MAEANFNQGQTDPSSAPKWYILNTIMMMRNSRASGNISAAFSYFDEALQLMLPFMESEVKKDIELDRKDYKELMRKIQGDTVLNDNSKRIEIERLKDNFMEEHRSYIFSTLPNAKVIQLEEEGVIDFNAMEFEKIKGIVRAGAKGLKASIDYYDGDLPNYDTKPADNATAKPAEPSSKA